MYTYVYMLLDDAICCYYVVIQYSMTNNMLGILLLHAWRKCVEFDGIPLNAEPWILMGSSTKKMAVMCPGSRNACPVGLQPRVQSASGTDGK